MKVSAAGTRGTTAHRHGQSSQPAIFSSAHTATATTSATATDWQAIAAKKTVLLLHCVVSSIGGSRQAITRPLPPRPPTGHPDARNHTPRPPTAPPGVLCLERRPDLRGRLALCI